MSERTTTIRPGSGKPWWRHPNTAALRWMYRTGRPNRLAAGMNRFGSLLGAYGVGPERMVALEVPGRRTGRMISLPVVVADHQGERYLVSMLGTGAGWVANVRAAEGRVTLRYRVRRPVRLVEVPPAERAPILRRYLELAPGARPHVPVDRRSALAEFERIAARYPVFRIEPDPTAEAGQAHTGQAHTGRAGTGQSGPAGWFRRRRNR
ncbi:PNPOx family protein [Micromonospora zhanjiangensis]|uniref:Nitroreductase family deazaflavin-dependent oxidoreductase n=1 Tax=Micromonospora zhanjiangensis TaxID=1522057 RepID=A0ABV8KGT7_9ACTN